MNRFTKFLCNLMLLGVSLGLTIPALAGPTPTSTPTIIGSPHPTPTFTPTSTPTSTSTVEPTPTATPTPEPTCIDLWPEDSICTIGKGQSPTNNPKVGQCITGRIVDPGSLGSTAHRIPVCAGTGVTIAVTDSTGTPTVTAGGSLSCDSAGCTGVVNVTEKYTAVSSDGKDTDRMTLLPK